MGKTIASVTVQSGTIANDDESDIQGPSYVGVASVVLNSLGTSPSVGVINGGPGRFRLRVTSGTGTPAAAGNNVVITLTTTRVPRKVFVACSDLGPTFGVNAVGAGTITLGTRGAPGVSTVYDFDIIVLF